MKVKKGFKPSSFFKGFLGMALVITMAGIPTGAQAATMKISDILASGEDFDLNFNFKCPNAMNGLSLECQVTPEVLQYELDENGYYVFDSNGNKKEVEVTGELEFNLCAFSGVDYSNQVCDDQSEVDGGTYSPVWVKNQVFTLGKTAPVVFKTAKNIARTRFVINAPGDRNYTQAIYATAAASSGPKPLTIKVNTVKEVTFNQVAKYSFTTSPSFTGKCSVSRGEVFVTKIGTVSAKNGKGSGTAKWIWGSKDNPKTLGLIIKCSNTKYAGEGTAYVKAYR